MTEFQVEGWYANIAQELETLVGPKRYHLHNLIGGQGWQVQPTNFANCIVRVDDPKMATWLCLKLDRK